MNLQSLLGYAHGSPFSSSPYLDISTPEGTITMENTPIDLLGIDNLGNAKMMKAGRKNPYKFKGNKVREIPLQKGGIPTLYTKDPKRYQAYLDSLYLYNETRGGVDSLRNVKNQTSIVPPRTAQEQAYDDHFDSVELRLDDYNKGKLMPSNILHRGSQTVYEYAAPKQKVILGDPPVPKYVPQERNLPNTDVQGVDMTTINPIQPTGRQTDVSQRPTSYSVTVRDESMPSKQRVIYFNNREQWRNFLDSGAVSPISTQERADSGSAATYKTMKRGGRKKQQGGNPYSQKELFDFIFDDEEEEGNVKGHTPGAPTVEEIDVQTAMNDLDAQRRLIAAEANDAMAMGVYGSDTASQRMTRTNPYSGDIFSSGQFGAQNVGNFGQQIYGQLATDLGYAPTANSIYRSKEQNDALIASGAPAAKNSWHLTGNAIDLKPADWHRLSDEQQQFYRNNYDVVTHNNHYHIEPK